MMTLMEKYPNEMDLRECMWGWIEGSCGCLGVWHEWKTVDIAKLYDSIGLEMGWTPSGMEY